ncbi:MAG: hypothetical protein H7319_05125 [Spirosoma sp.]|nr:hypothetical protein [Spirosoma sp.]
MAIPNKLLSTDGSLVNLSDNDDKSGRQQWRLISCPLTSPRPAYNRTIALKALNGQNVFAQNGGGGAVGASSPNLSIWEIFTLIDRGNGQVALQTYTGHFLCAEGSGGREVVANRNAIGRWETFKLLDRGNGQITLQAANGQYVFAQDGGGAGLFAKSVNLGTWEMFKLIDLSSSVVICQGRDYGTPTQSLDIGSYEMNDLGVGNDQLSSLIVPAGMKVTLYEHGVLNGRSKTFTQNTAYVGDDFNDITSGVKVEKQPIYSGTIALKASNGQTVFAQDGGGGAVGASSSNLSIWEVFTLHNLGNERVALQAFNGQYLSAVGGGGQGVVATETGIGTWETFKLLDRGNGQITLQAANGQYVFAQDGGGAGLYAKSVNLGTWEMFKLIDLSSSVIICQGRDYGTPTQVLLIGNHNLSALSIGGDQLSSLIVPAGMKVTLYEHPNYTGKSKTFTRNAAYVGDDFNDIASSIKVERLSVATYPVATITPIAPLPVVPSIVVTKPNVAVVLPIVLPAVVKSVRDEGKRIADAVKPLSEGNKALPADTTVPKPLSQLISNGGLPQFNVRNRLLGAVQNKKITLSPDLLGEFAEVGNVVSSLMNAFISIDNPSIALVKIKPGTSGEEGESFGNDPVATLSFATAQTTALRVSGNTTIFSGINVQLKSAEFSQLKGKPYGVLKFLVNTPLSVGQFLPSVPLLDGMVISSPVIVLSSSGDITDTQLGSGLAKGFNFFGKFKLGESKDKAFRFIGSFLGIPELLLHGVVDLSAKTPTYLVEAAIPIEKYIIDSSHFKVRFSKAKLGISIKGKPLEPAILVANEVIVTLVNGSGVTNLVFTGGLKLETESVTGSFTMQAQSNEPYTSPSETVVAGGEWKKPFGIPGITIRELALQTGLTYAPPFIDNFGIHGNLKIGDVDGSMSVLVDTNDPDQFVLAGATDHITIFQLMSAMSIPTFAAYQAIPGNIKRVLDKVVNLSLDNVKIHIVPTATSIGAIDFEEGITVMGKLTAWGWRASMFIKIDYEKGLEVRGEMDNINLSNVLRITGAQKDPSPILSLKLSPKTAPNLLISSNIYLLGLSQELLIKADETGLIFTFDRSISNVLETKLACSFGDGGNLVANGSINFNLNVTIPTPFGNIPLVDVGMNASTTMKVGPKYGFYTSISGSFSLYGKTVTMPTLTLNIAPNDFTGLYNAVIKQIADNAEAIFKAVFGTLAEWANAVRDGVLQATAEVASVAVTVYKASQQEAVRAYQTLNKGVGEAANGLRTAYGATEQGVATALRGAGYAADQVSLGLQSAYGTSAQGVATALRGAGYAADQVASGLSTAYGATEEGVATALRGAGYVTNEVAAGLKDGLNLGSAQVNVAMAGAGYTAAEVGNAFVSLGGEFESAGKATLEGLKKVNPADWDWDKANPANWF